MSIWFPFETICFRVPLHRCAKLSLKHGPTGMLRGRGQKHLGKAISKILNEQIFNGFHHWSHSMNHPCTETLGIIFYETRGDCYEIELLLQHLWLNGIHFTLQDQMFNTFQIGCGICISSIVPVYNKSICKYCIQYIYSVRKYIRGVCVCMSYVMRLYYSILSLSAYHICTSNMYIIYK